MSLLAIELSDAGIRAEGEKVLPTGSLSPSPGIAVMDDATLLIGWEAADRARLTPKRMNDRFWSELDTLPVGSPFPKELTLADLAFSHLNLLWERLRPGVTQVILAIPGTYSERQMGLTLGIAKACRMPVHGLVDSAVAASVTVATGARLLHLDLQLHRVVVTEIGRLGAELVRTSVWTADHVGLVSLMARWMRRIAGIFVNRTRFDPLHLAATEQEMYRRLPEWLRQLDREGGAILEIPAAGKLHTVEVTRQDLEAAVSAEYEAIVHLLRSRKRFGERVALLISDRLAGFPGLADRLADVGDTERTVLPEGAAPLGALGRREAILSPGTELPFVTRLPGEPASFSPPAGVATGRGKRPTHLVHDGRAHPIPLDPFLLGTAIPDGSHGINLSGPIAGISRSHCKLYRRQDRVLVEDHSSHGSFVNGQRVRGSVELVAGDRLRLGNPGIELQVIAMVDPDGSTPD